MHKSRHPKTAASNLASISKSTANVDLGEPNVVIRVSNPADLGSPGSGRPALATKLKAYRTGVVFPLTVAGAHGRNEPAQLAVPTGLTQKWPTLTSLEGAPAFNVARAYAAFAEHIANGAHTVPDFADAVRRHEVIGAIERSAASGQRVKP